MQVINDADFRKQLKSGIIGSYLFYGDEDYLKAHAVSLAAAAVSPDPSFALFNISKIDILDYAPEKLLDALIQPPMMAERKLVTLTGFDFTSLRSGEIDALCEILALIKEYDYTSVILSVAAGCIDEGYSPSKPSAIINKLSEYLIPVRFEKNTPQKLSAWAVRHFEHGGVKIGAEDLNFFIDYCGTGMYKLANEIDKLCAYVLYEGRSEVTKEDIRNVSIADTEFDTFALAGAIMEGRNADALAVLDFLRFKRTDPLIIFGEVSRTFCDLLMIKRLSDDGMSPFDIGKAKIMNEYRAKIYARSASKIPYERLYRKIDLCTDADRQLKLSPQGYSAIEMLICSE
ncbi:MAG: DNA polymerase III subunit delta [Clostridia bacterium]|nr:DNA polymerase III subunit delta [Clostridia bacterium]